MTSYEKSNSITSVSLNKFRKAEYERLLGCGDDEMERQCASQRLLDYLCEKFGMPSVGVSVSTRKQTYKTTRRGSVTTHGYYKPSSRTINIYNHTAKIGKVVAIKRFTETLLHEFMHHYDHCYLNIADSPHTTGFYKRISDLERKLRS